MLTMPFELHRVPETAVAVLYTGSLDVLQKNGWGRLPVILFLGHDTRCVFLSESSLGNRGVA